MNDDTETTPAPAPAWRSLIGTILTGVVLPLMVVGGGVLCAGVLIASRPSAVRELPPASVAAVQVAPLVARALPASITATGAVTPARQVRLTAEVSGRIVEQSPNLIPGGRFRKGEVLARIDARDYRVAVAQQERAVQQAELDLELERNRGTVAEREWTLLGDAQRTDTSLALRKPQLRTAERALEAARAGLDQAKHNVERATLVAPFDAVVIEEAVDVGQVVGPATPVATLVGTGELWVQVSVPVEKLVGIDVPGYGADEGSPARVSQALGLGQSVTRDGRVKQLMGQLDPQTRTAQLLVEVRDPYGQDGLPLLPGAWVEVGIQGRELADTWEVPRTALEEGAYVWVVDPENALRRRTVTIGWRTSETVIVTQGFEDGDRLVTSPLTLPMDGAPVRVLTAGEAG